MVPRNSPGWSEELYTRVDFPYLSTSEPSLSLCLFKKQTNKSKKHMLFIYLVALGLSCSTQIFVESRRIFVSGWALQL